MKEIVDSIPMERIPVSLAAKKSGIIGVEYYDSGACKSKAIMVFESSAWKFAKISDYGVSVDTRLGESTHMDKAMAEALRLASKMYQFDNMAEFAEWISAA